MSHKEFSKSKLSTIGPIRSKSENESIDNTDVSNSKIISVIENRSREVCICSIETKNINLIEIFIFADSHSYVETLSSVQNIRPNEVLIPDSSRNSVLSKKLESLSKQFEFRLVCISRQYFDQDRGADMLKRVIHGENDANLIAKYTVLAGAFCLMRYIENCVGYNYTNYSVRLSFNTEFNKERLIIDRRTLLNLELLSNLNDGSHKNSLFSILNYTKTDVGNRLLRQNIMSPILDIVTLETRLDIVDTLLRDHKTFLNIQITLSKFPDLDRMLNGLTTTPKKLNNLSAKRSIDTIIYLKQALKIIIALSNDLKKLRENNPIISCSDHSSNSNPQSLRLLNTIQEIIQKNEFKILLELISDFITESTLYSKSSNEMRHQECFAVKSGINGKLDLARVNYLQSVEDIHKIANSYTEDLGYPIKVSYTSTRGFHLSVPANIQPFPLSFIQPVLYSRHITCTTEEIQSLSDKSKESIENALLLTNEIVLDKLEEIRNYLDLLFVMIDAIALLDMLCSFVNVISISTEPYSRPKLTYSKNNNDVIVIKSGIHPVITKHKPVSSDINESKGFIPNDFLSGPFDNIQIITGPNGSGKTVYIKQIALIIVMAQIGCHVPAIHATIAVRDRILSRLGNNDDMEHNLSTFGNEMKDIGYVIKNLSSRSLVVIDELGRGTSNIDGLSIAFSIAESLIQSSAITLFVTHYPQITSLSTLYKNVKNLHMKATLDFVSPVTNNVERSNSGDVIIDLKYLHTVGDGPSEMKSGYGILMAEKCCFPNDVIIESKKIQQLIRSQNPVLTNDLTIDALGSNMRNVLQQLLLLRNTMMNDSKLCEYLQNIRSKVNDNMANQMLAYFDRRPIISVENPKQNNPVNFDSEIVKQFNNPNEVMKKFTKVTGKDINQTTNLELPIDKNGKLFDFDMRKVRVTKRFISQTENEVLTSKVLLNENNKNNSAIKHTINETKQNGDNDILDEIDLSTENDKDNYSKNEFIEAKNINIKRLKLELQSNISDDPDW